MLSFPFVTRGNDDMSRGLRNIIAVFASLVKTSHWWLLMKLFLSPLDVSNEYKHIEADCRSWINRSLVWNTKLRSKPMPSSFHRLKGRNKKLGIVCTLIEYAGGKIEARAERHSGYLHRGSPELRKFSNISALAQTALNALNSLVLQGKSDPVGQTAIFWPYLSKNRFFFTLNVNLRLSWRFGSFFGHFLFQT